MTTVADDSQRPFLDHLVTVLAVLEADHGVPAVDAFQQVLHYDGPRSWQMDSILRSLDNLSHRVRSAEDTLRDLRMKEDISDRPVKKRRKEVNGEGEGIRLALAICTSDNSSRIESQEERQNHLLMDRPVLSDCINTSITDLGESPSPTPSPDVPALSPSAASTPESPMVLSPSPALAADIIYRPLFMPEDASLTPMQAFEVVRVCTAVASGDLSQKIIAPWAHGGPLMGHLASILNDMARLLPLLTPCSC
ncbi:hypothetical protein CERSUDRAFT_96293 [Gelatoporia subvermispora B]|uniref:Uncharacterized protein n=1 Tax=Ceriporiopsis subvermispora (strain B) TaxID=914234 RepID=M2QGA0_CERS8|nr:hypothetical protein CERSUDRAFT_96293 [Gelatoporia subvermispora B]